MLCIRRAEGRGCCQTIARRRPGLWPVACCKTPVKGGRMEASAVDLSSARLENILEDGEFVLYRSAGAAPATPARSVLVVVPRSEHPRLQAGRMLEHEHALRGDLDPAWALRPLALTTLEGRPA